MTLYEMVKIIKAASVIARKNNFLVVGSQAILSSYPDETGAFEFVRSREIDLVIQETEREIADLLQGTLGEASYFDRTYGMYVDVVSPRTCILPDGWKRRLIRRRLEGRIMVRFLSPEDLAFSKYAVWRDKDRRFIATMWNENLLDIEKMRKLWFGLPKDRLSDEELSCIRGRFERQYAEKSGQPH